MTARRLFPYILTVILFSLIYWLTMIIPNEALYLGYGLDWQEVKMNNKIPLHREIFTYGLAAAILGINILEIFSTRDDKFLLRVAKSTATIILTYLIAALIFKLLDTKIWNLFYYYRGRPANLFVIATIILTVFGLVIMEGIKRLYLMRFDKTTLNRYIPKWLKMEINYL